MPSLLLIVPVLSTLVGGLLALRFRRAMSLLFAASAGLLLGAAFLDLLPEAISIGTKAGMAADKVLLLTFASFLLFFVLESALDSLGDRNNPNAPRHALGHIAGVMLVFHSFRDGMAIGAAYAASPSASYAVAMGIAAHDVGDGMNTVLFTGNGERANRSSYWFLAADAVAPFLGGLVGNWWSSSATSSVFILALAAGFFLQMATSDLLPEARRGKDHRAFVVGAVLAGSGIIYAANLLLGQIH